MPNESAPRVLLIDGGSGSGKTSLAHTLAAHWPGGVHVVSLDDCYPGWGGLAAASAMVPRMLHPSEPGYLRWDWELNSPGPWVALPAGKSLIIEGCGTLTPTNRALASYALWCELDETERRRRAIERDGATLAEHWDEWAAQEAEHWRRHRPWELADVVLRRP
ncbi:MAG: cobalt ABC transporter [Micropruina sp.]|nr:ATP-binding protein [Micropruina sp.]